MGIIIGEIVNIYIEIIENFEKILEELRKIFTMWKTLKEILEQVFKKNLKKFEYQISFRKTRRIFLDFSISFGKSFRCEGSSENIRQFSKDFNENLRKCGKHTEQISR